jgi:2-methylcitrate dehydratase
VAAGVFKALGLDVERTVNAIALSGTPFNALRRVTRTGALSHWRGFAHPSTAYGCTHASFPAMRGVSGFSSPRDALPKRMCGNSV